MASGSRSAASQGAPCSLLGTHPQVGARDDQADDKVREEQQAHAEFQGQKRRSWTALARSPARPPVSHLLRPARCRQRASSSSTAFEHVQVGTAVPEGDERLHTFATTFHDVSARRAHQVSMLLISARRHSLPLDALLFSSSLCVRLSLSVLSSDSPSMPAPRRRLSVCFFCVV